MAFVFPAQPELTHDDNFSFYGAVTKAGVDVPQFAQARNQVVLTNPRGGTPPSQLQIKVDHLGSHLRFMVTDSFPPRSFHLTKESADLAWEAFSQVWPLDRLGGQHVLAEVTIRATCAAEGNDATRYLMSHVLRLRNEAVSRLGRMIHGVGVRLVIPVQFDPGERVLLDGADANLLVETLLEDTQKLYFQLTCKWPSLPLPQAAVAQGAPARLNLELRKPSEYLEEVYSYLTGPVVEFLQQSGMPEGPLDATGA